MSPAPTVLRRRVRRGANAVEFALLFPIMLAMMTAFMDFGYMEMVRFAADSCARDGARVGALGGDPAAAASDAWDAFGLPGTAPTIVTYQSGSPAVQVVRVQVELPALVGLVVGPQTVEVVATRRVES